MFLDILGSVADLRLADAFIGGVVARSLVECLDLVFSVAGLQGEDSKWSLQQNNPKKGELVFCVDFISSLQ